MRNPDTPKKKVGRLSGDYIATRDNTRMSPVSMIKKTTEQRQRNRITQPKSGNTIHAYRQQDQRNEALADETSLLFAYLPFVHSTFHREPLHLHTQGDDVLLYFDKASNNGTLLSFSIASDINHLANI